MAKNPYVQKGYFTSDPYSIMIPQHILADAAHGVLYARNTYIKNNGSGNYWYTSLWVSFNYGENWIFREENIGSHTYTAANVEGVIYRGSGLQGMFKSTD